jgi:hypothetical protein
MIPRTPWKPSLRTTVFSGLAILLLSMAAISVYFKSFTGFSSWDDEGYFMLGLRSFLQGKPLYDDVYFQYGPFYYLVQASLYTVLHMPVTHDAVRAIMSLFWLLSAILCSWSVYRSTRSWILTALGFTAAIKLLEFFTQSPGHPEEICIALLAGVLVSACYLGDRARAWIACLLGSLIAALTLTKINIGCYAALAIGLALLKAMPGGLKQRVLFALITVAGLSLPFVILAPLLHFAWAQRTVVLVVLALSAAILVAWYSETERFVTPKLWIACVLASGVAAVLIVVPFLARGTTLSAMLYMSVLLHRDFAKNFYVPFLAGSALIPVLSLLLAIAWARMSASSSHRGPMIVALNLIKILLSLLWFFNVRTDHWSIMYNFVVPFTWLILVPSTGDSSRKLPFARVALCLLSVFSALYLLPVAGAQVPFSLVLTIPMVCVFLEDARVMLVTVARWGPVMRIVEVVTVIVLATANVWLAAWSVQSYRRLTPLALAGAERIRVRATMAADYQWITAALKNSCDSYFSGPGILSLYFWTQTAPPTRLLASDWVGMLNREQQQQVVNDLSSIQRLCVVYNPSLVEFWRRGQDLSVSPLARYINDDFAPFTERDGYVILVRADHSRR